MSKKNLFFILCYIAFLLLLVLIDGQVREVNYGEPSRSVVGGALGALVRYLLSRYSKEKKLKEDAKEKKELEIQAEQEYCTTLREELETVRMLRSLGASGQAVRLEDSFVSLRILKSWQNKHAYKTTHALEMEESACYLSPEDTMKQVFKEYRALMIIGEPGSGKTTLLKYYALNCLDKSDQKYKRLGFTEEVLPVYLPLRELEFDHNDKPLPIEQYLVKWSADHILDIPGKQFLTWLRSRRVLVLLDGLDEIPGKMKRRNVCQWIGRMSKGLDGVNFVVTSRASGYRKRDGIQLEISHQRANIMDFSLQQQEEFLNKWFKAVDLPGSASDKTGEEPQKRQQETEPGKQAQQIVQFLKQKDNKALQELAAVPMLLQIMATLWEHDHQLPESRVRLFDTMLGYLLEPRDRQKNTASLVTPERARQILATTALWMQEELQREDIPKDSMHQLVRDIPEPPDKQISAIMLCEHLRDRVGLIIDYNPQHYAFRYKSFREFLAAEQLIKDSHYPKRMKILVKHFKREDWWEDTLRFFMGMSNGTIFNRFMQAFFQSAVSRHLNEHQQMLLRRLVREAPEKEIDALVSTLNSDLLNNNQRRYVMDCLKTIGTVGVIEAIEKVDKNKLNENNRSYASDIIAETRAETQVLTGKKETLQYYRRTTHSFRSALEYNVRYIKIPRGKYRYSVSGNMETVPALFYCKYPVTNKQYGQFIDFLSGGGTRMEHELQVTAFATKLREFAENIRGYTQFLDRGSTEWKYKLRSRYHGNKIYMEADHPVVGISWYAARSYCFWLSCMETVMNSNTGLKDADINRLASMYRLPTEIEWEWAAGRSADGSIRDYPWTEDKGKPTPSLANYGNHVGGTTPVGRYPEGKNPDGLMDMAGNVWEWMENHYDSDEVWFALRGGSWRLNKRHLGTKSRLNPGFRADDIGFRVVRHPEL